jgi:magnesium transporter
LHEKLILEQLEELIQQPELEKLREALLEEHPADLATLLNNLEAETGANVLQKLPLDRQAEVFAYLEGEFRIRVSQELGPLKLAGVMNLMPHDDRADLLKQLDELFRDQVLSAMAKAEREDIRRLAAYPEGRAGAIMTSDYATVNPDMPVASALEKVRREAPERETLDDIYVIDGQRRLVGVVPLKALILSRTAATISQIMEENPLSVSVEEEQEAVARQAAKYGAADLPVVDSEHRLVGIITLDDALHVLQEEATEDFHRVGTVGKLVGNVRDAGVLLLYKKRMPWLILLVFANLLSGAGLAYFQDTIARFVPLVFFLPLLIDSSGNAGSQSATLMVRALATGEVVIRDWSSMLARELAVAALLGVTMAAAVSVIGIYRGGPEIAAVVSASMILVVLVGSLVGMSLPFILSRLNMDPAMASAPLITSIADASGVIIYLYIASVFLLPAA